MRTVYWNTHSSCSGREFSAEYCDRTSTRILWVTASDIGADTELRSGMMELMIAGPAGAGPGGHAQTWRSAPPKRYSGGMFRYLCASILALPVLLAAAPADVSFSQSAPRVAAYDFVEVTAAIAAPGAGNPFTGATLAGSFSKRGAAESVQVDGVCAGRLQILGGLPAGRFRKNL